MSRPGNESPSGLASQLATAVGRGGPGVGVLLRKLGRKANALPRSSRMKLRRQAERCARQGDGATAAACCADLGIELAAARSVPRPGDKTNRRSKGHLADSSVPILAR